MILKRIIIIREVLKSPIFPGRDKDFQVSRKSLFQIGKILKFNSSFKEELRDFLLKEKKILQDNVS